MIGAEKPRRRGGPLAMLGLLAIAWIGGRAMLWESPFALQVLDIPEATTFFASNDPAAGPVPMRHSSDDLGLIDPFQTQPERRFAAGAFGDGATVRFSASYDNLAQSGHESPFPVAPKIAAGHQLLYLAALAHLPMPRAVEHAAQAKHGSGYSDVQLAENSESAPFLIPFGGRKSGTRTDHWSLDAWAFWRQGSNATAISQGRVPIYGASQVGASLRYRLAPNSKADPIVYARAYRALVDNGETETAAGIAVRPVAALPVRAFAEVRYTDNRFRDEIRPAAFAVTELPPQELPLSLSAEIYAQAGYVGGAAATPFVDGQLVVSREVASFDLASDAPARLSVGAGTWGGAQEDATRLDVGPTVRLDLSIGQVPARVSLDWREQVAGDAAPASGVAATLSTRF